MIKGDCINRCPEGDGLKMKGKKTKKSKHTANKSKKNIPQKGDADFLTPTQLRNRRKRRAKQHQRGDNGGGSDDRKIIHNVNKKDPSMRYISNPLKAPIVQAAKKYFSSSPTFGSSKIDFHIHIGPLFEWRTVSKLAVRPEEAASINETNAMKPKVAIGLFLPQSHTLLPIPSCRAHHPSINAAVRLVTKACHEVGIVPYQEESDSAENKSPKTDATTSELGVSEIGTRKSDEENGQLRYVGINVARENGALQITLVWNGPAPSDSRTDSCEHPDLKKLVSTIIAMSGIPQSASVNANSSGVESVLLSDGRNGDVAESRGEPAKKRRRRGRREEKTSVSDKVNEGFGEREKSTQHRQMELNLHSLWVNYNPSWRHSNAIFSFDSPTAESSCWRHHYGPHAVIESLKFGEGLTEFDTRRKSGRPIANPPPLKYQVPLYFPPNVFRQANLDAFTHIVGRIREVVLKRASREQCVDNIQQLPACVELYGGVGTIGLHLSDIVSSLVSSDENPNNAQCFYNSIGTFPPEMQSKLLYKRKNAADMIKTERKLLRNSQLLVVDPPRKGLDAEVVDYLCMEGWKHLELFVYVSCGFQAFQQNCDTLLKSKKWKVEFAEGYLLFPGSDAIETLAFFSPTKG